MSPVRESEVDARAWPALARGSGSPARLAELTGVAAETRESALARAPEEPGEQEDEDSRCARPAGPVQVWTYGPANLGAIAQQTGQSVSGGNVQVSIPAQTIVLLVLASATADAGAVPGGDGGIPDAGPGSTPDGSSPALGDVVGSCSSAGGAGTPGIFVILFAWVLRRSRRR